MSYDQTMSLGYEGANPRLIDAMVEGRKRRASYAYFLWFFAGGLGFHNFYLGRPVFGAAQLIALAIGAFGSQAGKAGAMVALPLLASLLVSLLIDAFLIPARVRAYSRRLRTEIEAEADWRGA